MHARPVKVVFRPVRFEEKSNEDAFTEVYADIGTLSVNMDVVVRSRAISRLVRNLSLLERRFEHLASYATTAAMEDEG